MIVGAVAATALDPTPMASVDRVVVLGAEAEVHPAALRAPLVRWLVDDPAERGIDGLDRVRLMRDDILARVRALMGEVLAEEPADT